MVESANEKNNNKKRFCLFYGGNTNEYMQIQYRNITSVNETSDLPAVRLEH